MREDLVEILRCPDDKAELELSGDERDGDEIVSGTLTCTECAFAYPIEDAIPNLLPPEMHEEG